MIFVALVIAAEILANAQTAPCLGVGEGGITASVLASAVREFAALDPGLAIARAPEPGIRRVISARELNLVLRKHAPEAKTVDPLTSVCVVRNSRKLTEQEIRDAVMAALHANGESKTGTLPQFTVEVLDFSIREVGEGTLYFPLDAVSRPESPETPVVWRGWRKSRSGQRMPVWAKVRISERVKAPFAARDLATGEPIADGAIVYRETTRFPVLSQRPEADPTGRVPRRLIHAGEAVLPKDLGAAVAVRRGDAVAVQVVGGSVFLRFDGRAETSGQAGQKVVVSSALSKRMFQAVVKEKGHVLVTFDPASDEARADANDTSDNGHRRRP